MTNTEPRHKLTIKIGDALRTIQGYTMEESKLARAEAYDDLAEDLDLINQAKAVGAAGAVVAASATATPAPAVPTFAPPADASLPPSCQHGPRTPKSGSGAKGPWRAWMCPTPKGTHDQCQPMWVQRGSAEWSAFPA